MTDPALLPDEIELQESEQKATPATWGITRYSGGFSFDGPNRVYAGTDMEFGEPHSIPSRFNHDNDVAFIVAARNMVPALLERLQAMRAENERLRAEVAELKAAYVSVAGGISFPGEPWTRAKDR